MEHHEQASVDAAGPYNEIVILFCATITVRSLYWQREPAVSKPAHNL